ncbi:MAG: hypothetical protein CFE26_05295, partial [Verrucomicrobiales bacterium VVV1]
SVLRAIATAVGNARQDGRTEWQFLTGKRDFDDGKATQDIWVDALFADYAPAIAASAANASAFNAAQRAASSKQNAYQNSWSYKWREFADVPFDVAALGISAAAATDVTTGNAVTWNSWNNGGGFGLQEISPGERAFAAAMVFLPIGRVEGVVDDVARVGIRAERSFAGTALKPWGKTANRATTRVFWSGGDKMREVAEAWAKVNNATTLEMTASGQRLTATTKGLDWLTEGRPMWANESKVFAEGAQGDVHVFQWNSPHSLENMTIWREFEFPALEQQGNNIIFHLIDP